MRFERALILGLLLPLAGCITTHSDSNSLGKNIPQSSKAQQAIDAARVHTELGQHYMDNGDMQTALVKLNAALKFDPNYAPAHTVIAVLYQKINNLPEAEVHYRKAVELEPTKGDPNNNLGVFLCHTGKVAEAGPPVRNATSPMKEGAGTAKLFPALSITISPESTKWSRSRGVPSRASSVAALAACQRPARRSRRNSPGERWRRSAKSWRSSSLSVAQRRWRSSIAARSGE